MKQTTQFTALRPDSEDETRISVEMLNVRTRDPEDDARSQKWNFNQKPTLRETFSPFPWKTFLIISLLPIALAPIIVLSTAAEDASVGYMLGRDCYPNGMWLESEGATWRIMDSSYFFTPNLAFGSMTFTSVKIIDITWDLVVGRGGQILLAWVNYRVFNEWLLYHMEMHLTSYKMYTAVAFETTTMATLGVLGKEFLAFGKKSWKRFFRWLAMLCMFLSTLYVLSFPTLMAAMTGYITTYEAYVEDYDKNLIEMDQFTRVNYVIEDSSRIGFSKPLVVRIDDRELSDAVQDYIRNVSTPEILKTLPDFEGEGFYRDTTLRHFSLNRSSEWSFGDNTFSLNETTLNITLWYSHMDPAYPHRDNGKFRFGAYTSGDRQGDVYKASYIYYHGSCKPSETYQWGFSYIFLFMMSIFNFIWSCIMVGMWFDTTRRSRMYKSGRRPGLLRSIMDISGVMKEEIGRDADNLDEDGLRRRLNNSGGVLLVPQEELRITRTDISEKMRNRRGWRAMTKGSTF
ncbi:hypothetical protein CC78DRAFT_618045 [Lojkania enalia]|uniref:Uncharacterized protein n=1 Tax=Lojkania enalia TaxID=147567 RepID=A0A9P4MYU6_9PLEO|nr:hypothetical protein CC78DRAFT_618045 [Didymosphaeria enalia]